MTGLAIALLLVDTPAAVPPAAVAPALVAAPLPAPASVPAVAQVPAAAATAVSAPVPQGAAPAAAPAQQVAAPAAAPPPAPPESGVIVVSAGVRPTAADPLAKVNVEVFHAVQKVDGAVVAPVATGYRKALPSPVRAGLRNFLRNLETPVLLANNLLQFKPVGAARVVARFALNTTIGLGGLIDVAAKKPFHMRYIENGFGYTLGYYGIKSGPYFYLPLLGPTTLRDAFGLVVDGAVLPAVLPKPFASPYYALATDTIGSLDDRVEFDCLIKEWRASDSPYIAERKWYLEKRRAEIEALKGRKPKPPSWKTKCPISEQTTGIFAVPASDPVAPAPQSAATPAASIPAPVTSATTSSPSPPPAAPLAQTTPGVAPAVPAATPAPAAPPPVAPPLVTPPKP